MPAIDPALFATSIDTTAFPLEEGACGPAAAGKNAAWKGSSTIHRGPGAASLRCRCCGVKMTSCRCTGAVQVVPRPRYPQELRRGVFGRSAPPRLRGPLPLPQHHGRRKDRRPGQRPHRLVQQALELRRRPPPQPPQIHPAGRGVPLRRQGDVLTVGGRGRLGDRGRPDSDSPKLWKGRPAAPAETLRKMKFGVVTDDNGEAWPTR